MSQTWSPCSDNSTLPAALALAERGWCIHPLHPREKTPKLTGWPSQATTDQSVVRSWFEGTENNIGVVCGRLSGLVVIDVDPRNGGDASLVKLCRDLNIDLSTTAVSTSGGGKHLYFAYPPDVDGEITKKNLGNDYPGLDVKADRGYVVGPGSTHPSGHVYQFLNELPPAPIPAPLLGLLQKAPTRGAQDTAALPSAPPEEEDAPDLATIMIGCLFMQHVRDNAATLSEPEWYKGLSIAARCADGRRKSHQLSAPYPTYDATETDKKIDHALKGAGPSRCDTIEKDGFAGCARCPFLGSITSPIQIGRVPRRLAELQSRHVLVAETQQLRDLSTGKFLSRNAFDALYGHWFRKSLPFNAFRGSAVSPKAYRFDYLPGGPELIIKTDSGERVCNIWQDDGLPPEPGSCNQILNHFEYIVPASSERNHLFDLLAYQVQNRGAKIGHMVIIAGRQGTGKSWFAHLFRRLFGPSNVDAIESEHLHSRFRSQFTNTEVLVVEELMHAGRLELYNALKEWIVAEFVKVEDKNIPYHKARTPRLIWTHSNHDIPIFLEDDDRRVFIVKSPAEPKEKGYYQHIFGEVLKAEAAAFKHWLASRHVKDFEPMERPPMTEAKAAVIRESRPPLAREIAENVENPVGIFRWDIVTALEVQNALKPGLWGKGPPISEVTKALKQLKAIHIDRQIKLRDTPVRPWIIRNAQRWAEADVSEIAAYMRTRS